MKVFVFALLLSRGLYATTFTVCVTGTCPTAHNYTSISAAIAALSAPGDIVEIYPGQGDGTGTNGAPAGAYCGGNGNCAANSPIVLTWKPFANSANPFVIRTHNWAKLPKLNSRITPDYADGAKPVTALIYNVASAPLIIADYGANACALSLGSQTTTGVAYTANAGRAPDVDFPVKAGLITEDTSTGRHEVRLPFTSSSNTFAATVRFAPVPADATAAWPSDTKKPPSAMIGTSQNGLKVGGTSFATNDLLLVDQEVMKVTGGGGTSSLTVARGQTSPSGKSTRAQYMHYSNASIINLSHGRFQATIRVDAYTCVVDMSDGLGSVVSVTSGATCAIAPLGYLTPGYDVSGVNYPYWFQAEMKVPVGTITDKNIHIGIADGSGNDSYTGNGTGQMYFYKPQVVDKPGEDNEFRCAANAYKLEGLELGGGTQGGSASLISLPIRNGQDSEQTRLTDMPKNIAFEHILIRGPLEGARWDNIVGHPPKLYGTRVCLATLGRNITLRDSYLSGCAAQYQHDGAAVFGTAAGPVLYKNNYVDATASGLNTGISDAIYAFPMTFGHYFFRADFAHQWDATPFAPINNAGVGGQVEISYNHIEKPEYVRWMPWHPNTFVSKGTQWYPRTGGSWMLSIKTPGTTGPTEPTYCHAVNCEVTDGTAVWIMMLADTFYPLTYSAGTSYVAGAYAQTASGNPVWKAETAGTAGNGGLPGSCTYGQVANDGKMNWKCYPYSWQPSFPFKAHEIVNSSNLANHDKLVYASSNCTTGGTEPSWDYREGATTSDGTCTWTSSSGNSPWQSKNNGDNKTAVGAPVCPAGVGVSKCTPATTTSYQPWWYHHNYVYNSYAQHAQGGGQGNCINFQGATGQGFPSVSISNVLIEHNVFDMCMGPGMIIQGAYASTDGVFDWYCGSNGPFSTDPRCPWNNYSAINGVPITHHITVRHNRFSRIQAPPNSPAAVSNNAVVQFSSMIDRLTVDHNYMDASRVTNQRVSLQFSDFPVSNMTWTNNLQHTGGGAHFACIDAGPVYKCGSSASNTTEFPALNFQGAQATYTAGSIAAGTWPNPNAAYADPAKIGGNVFAGATSMGNSIVAANTGSGKLPSNNRFNAYNTLRIDQYYRVPAGSPIRNTSLDGTDPGPNPDQQPIIMNLVVTPSPTGATIAFDLTTGSAGVTPVLQLSTKQGFDLNSGPWVIPQYDPSLISPDPNGNTILSADNSTHSKSDLHRTFNLSGLADGTYHFRIHSGGQMVTGRFTVGSKAVGQSSNSNSGSSVKR